jgi:acyl carrier protein
MSEQLGPNDIEPIVRNLMSELVGGINPTTFDLETTIRQLGLDSLGMINLLIRIESEFELVIPEQDFVPENFGTTRAIIDYLRRRTEVR